MNPSTAALALAISFVPFAPGVTDSVLFDFEGGEEAVWQVVNDGVMGGRSEGFLEIADGTLRFTGTLVTRGGGFTSVRSAVSVDLSEYDGIELRVRGTGRTFELEVGDGTRRGWRSVSRRAGFATTGIWSEVRIPFGDLTATVFGQRVDAPELDASRVRRIGLFIADGKDGPFSLEVDWIRAYREG